MRRCARTVLTSVAVATCALFISAGAAQAATPGGLNLNLETDCADMSAQPQNGPDECVQALQEDLNLMGASILEDGYFGPQTQGAVLRFQSSYGMEPTGVADGTTRHSLQEDVDAQRATADYDPNAGPNTICDTVTGSGVLGKLGDVLGEPCKIIMDTGTAG